MINNFKYKIFYYNSLILITILNSININENFLIGFLIFIACFILIQYFKCIYIKINLKNLFILKNKYFLREIIIFKYKYFYLKIIFNYLIYVINLRTKLVMFKLFKNYLLNRIKQQNYYYNLICLNIYYKNFFLWKNIYEFKLLFSLSFNTMLYNKLI
jgi:hypothetical protein